MATSILHPELDGPSTTLSVWQRHRTYSQHPGGRWATLWKGDQDLGSERKVSGEPTWFYGLVRTALLKFHGLVRTALLWNSWSFFCRCLLHLVLRSHGKNIYTPSGKGLETTSHQLLRPLCAGLQSLVLFHSSLWLYSHDIYQAGMDSSAFILIWLNLS